LCVDWSRRCYQSQWHLFRDALEITSGGRYYRPPPDTPFLRGLHHYGSREWYETNWPKIQWLGESLTAPHTYDKGPPPETLPDNRIVGSKECIANGGRIANALPYNQFINGFPNACFVGVNDIAQKWAKVSTYLSCSLQFFYSRCIEFTYDADIDSLFFAFNRLIPGCTLDFRIRIGLQLNYCIVKSPGFCVVVIEGSSTAQQFAMQGVQGLRPPIQYGNYSTLPLWFDAASDVLNEMEGVGVDMNGKFMIVGHSYGAATALNVVARLQAFSPLRVVRYLTFGTPKPGDARMAKVIEDKPRGIMLANTGDLVTAVPPAFPIFFALFVVTGNEDIKNWDYWKRPSTNVLMDDTGQLTFNDFVVLDFATLATMLAQILALQPFDTVFTHFQRVYSRRIRTRCPNGEWPIDPVLWAWLNREDGMTMESPELPDGALVISADIPALQPAGELVMGEIDPAAEYGALVMGEVDPAIDVGAIVAGPIELPDGELVAGPIELPDGSQELGDVVPLHSIGDMELGDEFPLYADGAIVSGPIELPDGELVSDGPLPLPDGWAWVYLSPRQPAIGGSNLYVTIEYYNGEFWLYAEDANIGGGVDFVQVFLLMDNWYDLVIVDDGASITGTIGSESATYPTSFDPTRTVCLFHEQNRLTEGDIPPAIDRLTVSDVPSGTVWDDTFTDADGTLITAHTPDLSPGGVGYFNPGTQKCDIQGNAAVIDSPGTGLDSTSVYFNTGLAPGTSAITTVIRFKFTIPP